MIVYKDILINCWSSLARVLCGGSLAFVFGVTLGLLRFSLPNVLKRNFIFNLIVDAPRFPPPIAWIPFVILAFGISDLSSWAIVFIGVFPAVFINTYEGLSSIKPEIIRTARSMELSKVDMLFKIYFPAILPQIFTGLRVGLSMGWMSIIAAEMISGQSGLGYSIQLNRINLQYNLMVVDMILISVVGFFINQGMLKLQEKVVRWKN